MSLIKTKILAITPYQGMKEIMNDVAKSRTDIDLTIRTGNLKSGLEIVQSYLPDDFDVIISRGGTAQMIAANVQIPVVEIELSVYDILRAIKLAENYTKHFAIMGYAAITDCAKMLCNLLKYDIKIITIEDQMNIKKEMLTLKNNGYEMILCDMIGTSVAYELGLNFILITSGRESIDSAINRAVQYSSLFSYYKEQASLFKSAITQSGETLFIYTTEGHLTFSNIQRNNSTEFLFHYIEKNLPSILADPTITLEECSGKYILSSRSHSVKLYGHSYVYIYLRVQDAPPLIDDLGVSVNHDTALENSDFYGSAIFIGDTRQTLEQYTATLCPILILGETGTGKEHAAYYLYEHSEYRKKPYLIIDCAQTPAKKWAYLMENVNSPLNDLHTTIYIKNLQVLNEAVASKFLYYLKQNDCCKRNHFIFSYTLTSHQTETNSICQFLMNNLSCLVLRLLPLRQRTDDIPSIATLYISQSNIEFGKQIVGFEPEALELIKTFNWDQNLAQLKRIIRQLIVLTDDYYITSELVWKVLKEESPEISSSLLPGYEIINTNQTLDDINYDIVRLVLKQEQMNKTKTVERLGISRSTLWRMLQK